MKTRLCNASLLTPQSLTTTFTVPATKVFPRMFGHETIAYFESVDIEIRGDIIHRITTHQPVNLKEKDSIDGAGKLVIPGLINTHTHLAMSLLKGTSDDLSLMEWLTKTIFPIEGKFVSESFVKAGVELSLMGTIACGVTTYVDMYMFSGVSADVLERQGVRAWVGQGIIDFAVPDNPKLTGRDYAQLEALVDRYGVGSRITPAIAPHSPYSVCDASFEKVLRAKTDLKVPMMIHMCEMATESEASLRDYGMTPLERLCKLGFTGPDVLLAHSIHFSESEFELLTEHQFAVAHNPVSNMKLGSGVADIPRMLKSGVRVGLGSDGQASHNSYDFMQDLKFCALLHKLDKGGGEHFSAAESFFMATLGGAQALGMGAQIGSIEEGKKADLAMIDKNSPCFIPYDNSSWLSHFVYAASEGVVTDVMVDGGWLFKNRQYLHLDQSRVIATAQEIRAGFKL